MPKKSTKNQSWFRLTKALIKVLLLASLVAVLYAPIARNVGAFVAWTSDLLDHYSYRRVRSYGIRMPTRYQVHGIDVSRYQGKIDWEKVAAMESDDIRISFAFIKASEGMLLVDQYFQRNWRESREHGVIRGAYHYFKPHINAGVQARLFLNTVKLEPGDLPPVVDVEEIGRLSPEELRERLQQYLSTVEEKTGVKPIIYAGLSFYEDYLAGHFDGYPYWVAHYHRSRPRLQDEFKWTFWQHSDKGNVNGIAHRVDFNVFGGEAADLLALCIAEE